MNERTSDEHQKGLLERFYKAKAYLDLCVSSHDHNEHILLRIDPNQISCTTFKDKWDSWFKFTITRTYFQIGSLTSVPESKIYIDEQAITVLFFYLCDAIDEIVALFNQSPYSFGEFEYNPEMFLQNLPILVSDTIQTLWIVAKEILNYDQVVKRKAHNRLIKIKKALTASTWSNDRIKQRETVSKIISKIHYLLQYGPGEAPNQIVCAYFLKNVHKIGKEIQTYIDGLHRGKRSVKEQIQNEWTQTLNKVIREWITAIDNDATVVLKNPLPTSEQLLRVANWGPILMDFKELGQPGIEELIQKLNNKLHYRRR